MRPPLRAASIAAVLVSGALMLPACAASMDGRPAAAPAPVSSVTPAPVTPTTVTPAPVTPTTVIPTTVTPTTVIPTTVPPATLAPPTTTPATSPARSTSAALAPSTAPAPSSSAVPSVAVAPPAPGRPVVVLNPGHNGGNAAHATEISRQVPAGFGRTKECDTTGTQTDAGYPEHAYTWDVVLRLRQILQAHGVRVVLTRPDDTGVGPCVDERAATGNHPDVAAVISIHGDGAPADGHGFFVNTASRRPDGAGPRTMRRNGVLARDLRDALVRYSGLTTSTYLGTDGIYATDAFAGLNLATRPAAFLEIGNMRNAGDAAVQSSASGRRRIAEAVAAGVLTYLARLPR